MVKKASQRRLRKIAKLYTELVRNDQERFLRAWDKRTQRWLADIQIRAALLRTQISKRTNNCMDRQDEIFEVLESANCLIAACGHSVNEMIGEQTRSILRAECAKAVASVYDRRLYAPVSPDFYNRRI